MSRIFVIAFLTWKAALRFKLFWVLMGLLLVCVVALPLLVKDDGTARGFTQILLTYTLSIITSILAISTLWLGCGTLARDIEENQMQMVAVKPIGRWQIWLGKWLGLVMLNAVLLTVSGAAVFVLLKQRASRLPPDQQRVLRNEVFVARAALKPPAPNIEEMVERAFSEQVKKAQVPEAEYPMLRAQIRERAKAYHQLAPPGYTRSWVIDLGVRAASLKDEPLFLRAKFYVAQTNLAGSYFGTWQFGAGQRIWTRDANMAADTFHELEIPPGLIDSDGKLLIRFINRERTVMLFPLEEGLEVLFREGNFGLNFARGLGIVLCWLALLAAIGLASASMLSFPVAAFFSASLLFVLVSSGNMQSVVEEGGISGEDHETGVTKRSMVDVILLPVFKAVLWTIQTARGHSPIDSLSTGRSITWGQLALAGARNILLLGGAAAFFGIIIFNRRELAAAHGTSG